ncbi:hypothetical protein JCM19037_3037 [Geomicrobium sp. JCM 19037]|uniref:GNAT family N-acetyltransferase n=1 Tax=Geomicrobium sp. JCM 19037 TaxID=1460634 RepID=UPI00045F44AD|nr:GNAT family N-acetyltransferase [Geomicrobium sp. JCM 19037]GAK04605.1 hypothetical protein JCM19037_3037 [Geomicrobium sp. JCM 19037]
MNIYHTANEPEVGVLELHEQIFGDCLQDRLSKKPATITTVATIGDRVVGYKIGYPQNDRTFYSWLGGVDKRSRGQGIGKQLMKAQHEYVKQHKYTTVETKTMNKWQGMLILNIQSGFMIYGTHLNQEGEVMIMLRKQL